MAYSLGRVGIVAKGNYSATTSYVALDMVSYQDGLYVARSAVPTGTAPTNTTYWMNYVQYPTVNSSVTASTNAVSGAAVYSFVGSKIATAV